MITIGIDPHKRTHTAVAIDEQRRKLGELEVVASARMARSLLAWARAWPARCWAIEGSDGLGKLLAQQLLAAGETVVEVPASLAARARLLRTGHGRKTDGIDALSVAEIAAARDDLRDDVRVGHRRRQHPPHPGHRRQGGVASGPLTTDSLTGRRRAVLLATTGQSCWPPLGRSH